MKSYKRGPFQTCKLDINQSTQGETIEQKIDRIVHNKEPIKDGAPLIYQERKEGIRPSTNIRTDRFEVAIEAADKIDKSYKARREERADPKKAEPKGVDTGGESTQGKGETPTK